MSYTMKKQTQFLTLALTLCSLFLFLLLVSSCSKKKDPVPVVITPPPSTTTVTTTKSSAKSVLTFAFAALSPAVNGTIDNTAKTISATVASGTDVTKLVPTLTLSDKATVSPASGVAQDFSKAITYTITAEDGSTQAYVAKIDVEIPDALNDFALFGADKKLYGYDAETGAKKWEYSSASSIYTAPTVVNGVAYIVSGNSLLGIDVKTGAEKWNYYLGYVLSNDALTIADNVVYFVSNSYSPYKTVVGAVDINAKRNYGNLPFPEVELSRIRSMRLRWFPMASFAFRPMTTIGMHWMPKQGP
jgi:eukaryotic-like serine/threonine-protein kinase